MKNNLLIFASLIVLSCISLVSKGNEEDIKIKNTQLQGSFVIYCNDNLYALATVLSDEFSRLHPNVTINVKETDETFTELNDRDGKLFLTKNQIEEKGNVIWKIVVGRDIIVPVFNANNPLINEINKQGISKERLAEVLRNSDLQNWGTLLSNSNNQLIHFYRVLNSNINVTVSNFLNIKQVDIEGENVIDTKEMISLIQKDPLAIGFFKITDILSSDNHVFMDNIKLLPIDINSDGRLGYDENIFDDLNAFTSGISIGKYPKSLYSSIYFNSSSKPVNKTEIAFLKWVIADGQALLNPVGFCDLTGYERMTYLRMLDLNNASLVVNDNYSVLNSKNFIIVIVANLSVLLILILTVKLVKKNRDSVLHNTPGNPISFSSASVSIPKGLLYDKTHTWAFMEKDGFVKVGLDDFIQHITGPITKVIMKNPGDKIKKGEQVFSIQQEGKQLSIYAPISGTVKEHNKLIKSNSTILNSSPYSDGWVYKIEPSNWTREIQFLIRGDKYKEWLNNEFSRIKDFLSSRIKPNTNEYALVILQDGGELKDSFLSNLGPEVWDDFQSSFIDNSN